MIPKRTILLAAPIALLGAILVVRSTVELSRLQAQVSEAEARSNAEAESFVETLQGAHAEQQLKAYDDRRSLALEMSAARRNRFLGLFGIMAAGFLAFAITVLSRVSSELRQDQELFTPPESDPSGRGA